MQKLSYWLLAIACCFSLMAKAQTDEVKGNRTAGHLGIRNYGIDHDYAYIVGHKCADHEHAEMSAEKLVDGALMLLAGDCYTEQEHRLTYIYDKEVVAASEDGNEGAVRHEIIMKKNNDVVQNYVIDDNRGITGLETASFDPDRANKTLSYGNPDLFRGVVLLVGTGETFRVDSLDVDLPVFKLKFWYTGNYVGPVGNNMHIATPEAESAGKYVFVHAKFGEQYIANIGQDRNKDGWYSEAVEVHHIHKILCINPEESHKDSPYLMADPDGWPLTSDDGWDDNIQFADAEPAEGLQAPTKAHHRLALFRLVPVEPGWAFSLNYKYQVTDTGLEYMQSDVYRTETWEGDPFVPESNFDFYRLKETSFEVLQDYSAENPLIVPCESTWPVSFTQNISIGMPFPDNTSWHMLYANDDNTKWVNYDMNSHRANFDPYAVGRGYMWAFRWVKWPNEAAAYNMASDLAYSLGLESNPKYVHPQDPTWFIYNQDWAQLSRAKLEQFFIFLRNGNGFSMAFPDHDAQGTLTTNARLGYNGEEQYGTANQLVIGYNGLSSSEQKNRLVADRIKAESLIEEAASIYYPVRQADDEPRRVGAYTATQDEIDAYNASVATWKNDQTIEESIETMIDNYGVVKPTEIVHTPEGYYRLVVKNGVRPGNNASDVVVVGPQKVKGKTAAESMGTDWKYRQIFVRSKIVADPNDGLPYNYTFSYYDGLWQIKESDGKMRFKHANSKMYMLQPDAPVWLSAEDYANVDYDFEHTGESSNIWFLWGREKGKTDFQKVGVNQWGLLSNNYGDDQWAQWYVEEVTEVPLKVSNTNGDGTGYASLCLPFAVELPDGLTAYYASGIGTNEVELSEITDGIVPAHTGVLVSGAAADNYQLSIVQTDKEIADNQFVGTTLRTTGFAKDEMYVYAKGYSDADGSYLGYGFYLNAATLTAVPANKLYIPAGGVASGARALSLHMGGAETGIEKNLMPNGGDGSEVYYDINGRRVLYPSNGIFVTKSGKKVFIR